VAFHDAVSHIVVLAVSNSNSGGDCPTLEGHPLNLLIAASVFGFFTLLTASQRLWVSYRVNMRTIEQKPLKNSFGLWVSYGVKCCVEHVLQVVGILLAGRAFGSKFSLFVFGCV